MSRFLNVLRSWLVLVSILALANGLQSFRDYSFLQEKLYTSKPDLVMEIWDCFDQGPISCLLLIRGSLERRISAPVNGLHARTFGIWLLLSSVTRCLCAIDIHNKKLYYITIWTFILALGHFLSELLIYGTVAATIGVLSPLIVASSSILAMLAGLQYLEMEPVPRQKRN
ncbi:ergosterol biosynthetic protein 28 homolog isoform X1 [Dasypus novemcinctus]|uniref:ergosterol biosynthetic protein 28 homolog isoform X1 n=1 Tax=Dasypus novemcinctus TaxID=9361 RepID=UPI00032888CF|nr:ergosterol biosynthetic protein 28 homolog isoform X3 [Dasypus novemcinctus]